VKIQTHNDRALIFFHFPIDYLWHPSFFGIGISAPQKIRPDGLRNSSLVRFFLIGEDLVQIPAELFAGFFYGKHAFFEMLFLCEIAPPKAQSWILFINWSKKGCLPWDRLVSTSEVVMQVSANSPNSQIDMLARFTIKATFLPQYRLVKQFSHFLLKAA